MKMSEPAIAAISTPSAPGGIGIIRISGENALGIAAKVFTPISGEDLTASKGYRAYYGSAFAEGKKADEAVCLVYRAPHSYTGEDVAEINCHGGLFITNLILRAVIEAGARPAQPGEFTKRAFLNGKMDLAESESVMALIGASGRQAANAALNTLDGRLSGKIDECAKAVAGVCASLSAWVDYPDEDIEEITAGEMEKIFSDTKAALEEILGRYDSGRAMTEGIETVIVGRPNVGKSTVMNLLTGYERSIVTDVAGTTRDAVEEKVLVGDIVLRIADTAGIRQTDDKVENIGVEIAKKRLERAELVIAVFDSAEKLTDEDREIIALCKGKKSIALLNKSDLAPEVTAQETEQYFDRTVTISAKTGEGRDEFEKALTSLLLSSGFDSEAANLTGERQRDCCQRAVKHLEEALEALHSGVTLDAVNVCADCAVDALLELTGKRASAAVVDEVFSRFCVGK